MGSTNADRPDIVPGRSADDIILGGPDQYFDPTAFVLQPAGYLGNAPRNFLQGPGQVNLDVSFAKEFPISLISEEARLDFRFETFNLFNHANFNIPVTGRTIYTATSTTASNAILAGAGKIDRTRSDSRKIQFGLKLTF